LELGLRGREFSRYDRVREPAGLVTAIAKWLIGGLPAAAEAHGGAAAKAKRPPFWID
jgi:hypothetical protein